MTTITDDELKIMVQRYAVGKLEPDDKTDPYNVNEFNRLWMMMSNAGVVGKIDQDFYQQVLKDYIYDAPDDTKHTTEDIVRFLYLLLSLHYVPNDFVPFQPTITYDLDAFSKKWDEQADEGYRDSAFGSEYCRGLATFLQEKYDNPILTEHDFLTLDEEYEDE